MTLYQRCHMQIKLLIFPICFSGLKFSHSMDYSDDIRKIFEMMLDIQLLKGIVVSYAS